MHCSHYLALSETSHFTASAPAPLQFLFTASFDANHFNVGLMQLSAAFVTVTLGSGFQGQHLIWGAVTPIRRYYGRDVRLSLLGLG